MNIRQIPLEELELLSYTDIAYELLKLDKNPKTTPVLFGEVCKLLKISEDNMFEMIGDFYTTLTTDKRFLLLDSAEWDLREFHVVKPIVDEEEDEDSSLEEENEEEEIEGNEDDAITHEDDDFDDTDDSFEDLAIISEEELEEE